MPVQDPIYRLSSLTARQREVLQLFCDGFRYKAIADQLVITENTVKSHMGNIYVKLGVDMLDDAQRRKMLHQVFCQALDKLGSQSEDFSELKKSDETEPVPEEIWEMVENDEKAIQLRQPTSITPPPTPQKRPLTHPTSQRWRLIIFIVVIVFLCATALFGAYWIGKNTSQPLPIVNVTVIVPTAKASIAAGVTHVTTTLGVFPTSTPTYTPTSENTKTPESTVTPTPVLTEPFVPPSDGVLFFDDFESGFNQEWKVVRGEPFIANGKLSSTSSAWLMIGDSNWQNYKVDLDEKMGSEMAVCVHVDDIGNMYCLHIYLSSIWWFIYNDGNSTSIPDTNVFYFDTSGHVEITVQDNQISSTVAGRDVGSFWDSNFERGGVALYVQNYTNIDDFIVTWLP